MRDLILTCGWGYEARQLRPLLTSSARHCPAANVVVIVGRADSRLSKEIAAINPNASCLKANGSWINSCVARIPGKKTAWSAVARVVALPSRAARVLAPFVTHVSLSRYLIAHSYLQQLSPPPDHVLLCDSRDVIVQADPFARLPAELVTGFEERLIRDCEFNSRWIRRVYGDQGLQRVATERIVCSGVTIGTYAGILEYLTFMCREITGHLSSTGFTGALDQAVHNWLIHTGQLENCVCVHNGSELLCTLHYSSFDELVFDQVDGIRNRSGALVRIVHQYDRHASMADWAQQTWAVGRPVKHRSSEASLC